MSKHFDAPVDLRTAFVFTCHDCGRDSFTNAETLVFKDDASRQEIAEELGIAVESVDSVAVGIPNKVQCTHCSAEFRTAIDGIGPVEEE